MSIKPRRQRALMLLLAVLLPISFIGALYFGGVYIIENLIIAAIVYKLFWHRSWSRKKRILVILIPLLICFVIHLYIYQLQVDTIRSANRVVTGLEHVDGSDSCVDAALEQYDADWLVNCEAHWGVTYNSMEEANKCELPESIATPIQEKLDKAIAKCSR
ncbi:MAG: hypothetical protein JNK26_04070 [Candidatus Doudnabacteria bacterium]|nr:hypothetical protein [Candidatus Doudnabacteria bacterium]